MDSNSSGRYIITSKKWKVYMNETNNSDEWTHFENLNGKYKVEYIGDEGVRNIYEGDWKNNKKHGKGKLIYEEDEFYEGDFKYDKFDGKGKYVSPNYFRYEGDFKNNEYHGKGKFTYSNGDIYEGDWKDGNKHGKGKMTYSNGDIYEGDWKDGIKHGKGKMTYSNGDIYEGDWKNDMMNGKGKMTYHKGSIYEGDWKNDRKHGKGKMTYTNGDMYEGDWKNDKGNGKGKYTCANGEVYEGDWKDGKRNGKGTMTFATGAIYKGDYKDGKKHGKGKLTWADGAVYHGDWKDNDQNGKGTITFADGDMYEGDWKDGHRTGKGKETYADGRMYEGDYQYDDRNGYGVMFFKEKKYSFPAGSTYHGYWKGDKVHTEGTQLGKLIWPEHNRLIYDTSPPGVLRSFEGKWVNNSPITTRDSPVSLQNWGNYVWKDTLGTILIDQNRGSAIEIHEKAGRTIRKLQGVLDVIERILPYTDQDITFENEARPEEIVTYIEENFSEILSVNNSQEELNSKKALLSPVLWKLRGTSYLIDRISKKIILKCLNYIFKGNHSSAFKEYYVNSFIDETSAAYTTGSSISCGKGIYERFYVGLQETVKMAISSEGYGHKPEYDEIAKEFGDKKLDMATILCQFDESDNDHLLNGKSQSEKVRILIDFIKNEYGKTGHDLSIVEADLDEFLESVNQTRDGFFKDGINTTFGGKKKGKTKKRRHTRHKTKGISNKTKKSKPLKRKTIKK